MSDEPPADAIRHFAAKVRVRTVHLVACDWCNAGNVDAFDYPTRADAGDARQAHIEWHAREDWPLPSAAVAFALSPRQRNAVLRLGGQRDGTFAPVKPETLRALERRDIAERAGAGGWSLTQRGTSLYEALAERLRAQLATAEEST